MMNEETLEKMELEVEKERKETGEFKHENYVIDLVVGTSLLCFVAIIVSEFYFGLPSSFQACDKPLKLFIYVAVPPQILLFILLCRTYLVFSNRMKANLMDSFSFAVIMVVSLFLVSWMCVGGYWLFKSETCKSEAETLYKLCLAVVVIFIVSIGFNFCCLPIWMGCYSRVKKNRISVKSPEMPGTS